MMVGLSPKMSEKMSDNVSADEFWGVLGPSKLPLERRVRTLGLGALVRRFNDEAVPGLGGVWFAKQYYLALLGVRVAELANQEGFLVRKIEVANAIEALACRFGLEQTGFKPDPGGRLLGMEKLQQYRDRKLFKEVRRAGFYVTQPMRMATVSSLPALGLVEPGASRFNAFQVSEVGLRFLELVNEGIFAQGKRWRRDLADALKCWVMGTGERLPWRVLSPIEALPAQGLQFLTKRLREGSPERLAAMNWVEDLRMKGVLNISIERKPSFFGSQHWKWVEAGTAFFLAQGAAIHLLEQIEAQMSFGKPMKIRDFDLTQLASAKRDLRAKARTALERCGELNLDFSFLHECCTRSDSELICNLVKRDDRVLVLRDDEVIPGGAFLGKEAFRDELLDGQNGSSGSSESVTWPEGLSFRFKNLFYLNADLKGELLKFRVDPGVQNGLLQ